MSYSAMPSSQAISNIMNLINNSESANYFKNGIQSIIKNTRDPEEFSELSEAVDNFVHYVEQKSVQTDDAWKGKELGSYIQIVQQKLAALALKQLENLSDDDKKNLIFDWAIQSESSNFVRGYSTANGNELKNDDIIKALDALFNKWLVDHNMIIKDGTIYKTDKEGDILTIKEGKKEIEQKASPDSLIAALSDKENGFAASVEKNTAGTIQITSRQQAHPEQPIQPGAAITSQ